MATKRKFEIGDVVMLKSTGEVFKIKRYVSPHYVVDDGRCYTAVQLKKAGDENFKYGDRVRVIEDTGTLEVGEVGTIIAKDNDRTYLFESDTDSHGKHRGHEDGLVWGRGGKFGEHRCGWVFPEEVEKIVEEKQEEKKEEIHITRKGSEVHAILKKDGKLVKRTVAKCHPDDEFDFERGAKLAMNRLYEAEVLKENKLYNGYVLCVDNKYNKGLYTKGQVYKFENGVVKCNDGSIMSGFRDKPFMSFEDWKEFTSSEFKEINVVTCDKYKRGDKVLVKFKNQVKEENLSNVYPCFIEEMERFCGKVIRVPEDGSNFRYHGFTWTTDFIVGKVVE